MKSFLTFLFCCAVALTARAGWQAELTTQPGSFPPLRPLHAHYKFGWGVVNAAEAEFDYGKSKIPGAMRLSVSARSIGAARGLWKMDAEHVAVMQLAGFHPISVLQTEVYGDKTHTTKLDFTSAGVTQLRESIPAGPKPPKLKRVDLPNLLDLHSAIHFIRSQRLKPGDDYKIAVYPATAAYLAEVKVVGKDSLRLANQPYEALKLDLKLWKINKRKELETHGKFKRATIWLSDDANRMLLKVQAQIFVGSVWCELDKIEYK